jgi:short-subunit dehydrogenase
MRAVVTGASSGIGQELARQLAQAGSRILVTARRAPRLQKLCDELRAAGHTASFVAGDIRLPAVRQQLLGEVRLLWGGLDLLVNNAGIGAIGPFAEADEARLRHIMEVNFFAPVELLRSALPLLRNGNQPMVVNVGSVLGHRAVPRKSEYCASKFALHGFSDSVRAELASCGVDVLLVSPSTTESEFFDHVLDADPRSPQRSWGAVPATTVARKTVQAIRRGRHEIILTAGGKLLVWLDRLCPPLADRLLARWG